ncbi:MAG: cysteine synthase [Candidatus Eremiobacteraeota bacterium]|nr:cysteine synthase [Candidatus Eremiobacteraeota bacterium]
MFRRRKGGPVETNELVREREVESRSLLIAIAPSRETLAAASARGLDVVIVGPDGAPGCRPAELPFHPADLTDAASVQDILRRLASARELAGVITSEGHYLRAVAECSSYLGLQGALSVEAASRGENKLLARRCYELSGVRGPRFAAATSAHEAVAEARRIGWPVVVKPANDSNSRAVTLCRNRDDTEAAFAAIAKLEFNLGGQRIAPEVLIEEYIDGPEYSVELFVDHGVTTIVAVCEKALGPAPFFVEVGHAVPASVSKQIETELCDTARAAVGALGARHCVAHAELRVRGGKAFVVEVNLRVAGGKLADLVRTVTGWDLPSVALDIATGRAPSRAYEPQATVGVYHCLIADAPSTLRFDQEPIVLEGVWPPPLLELDVPPGTLVFPVNDARGRIFGRILAYGDDVVSAWSTVRTIRSLLRLRLEPADDAAAAGADGSGCWKAGCC